MTASVQSPGILREMSVRRDNPARRIRDTDRKPAARHLLSSALPAELGSIQPQNACHQLATRLGVSRQTVNAIETGRYHPSLPLAFDIARVFDCRIEDVFHADESGPAR